MITPIFLNELFNQLRNSHQGNRKHRDGHAGCDWPIIELISSTTSSDRH